MKQLFKLVPYAGMGKGESGYRAKFVNRNGDGRDDGTPTERRIMLPVYRLQG